MINRFDNLFFKIRKYGVVRSFQIFFNMCWPHVKHVRFITVLNPLFYYYLGKLILIPNFAKKRILGIWDYKSLPWDVGDPLVFIETLSILKLEHNAEEIDICVVYDRDKPLGKRTSVLGDPVTTENHQEYSLEYLPLYSTCPYLGTVYQFNSRNEFYRFLKINIDRYDIFPPLSQHLGETYDYYDSAASEMKMIKKFFDNYGYIPFLRIGERDKSWARWFYLTYLPENSIAIALTFKMTSHDSIRNADPAVWLSFIDRCKIVYPELMFIIIGLREEAFDGLRDRKNVVIGKDHGTSLVEDFALIRASLIYMGTSSGINAIAMFSDTPYLIFQLSCIERYGLEERRNWFFANDRQRIFSTKIAVTPELLFQEFTELYIKVDKDAWHNSNRIKACNKNSHPSAIVLQSEDNRT
jgi:hypothetical protein